MGQARVYGHERDAEVFRVQVSVRMTPWTCDHCRAEQTDDTHCQVCHAARYSSWDVQLSRHVLEHIADGLDVPLDVQEALNARPCYARVNGGRGFALQFVVSRMRMLTRDTTAIAQALVKARSAPLMLEAMAAGSAADKIRILEKWGPKTNADTVEHTGKVITSHVVELVDGPPPKGEK